MSQISATPGITTTTLGQYIRKDGTTTTTAIIPFALGLSIPTGNDVIDTGPSLRIGSGAATQCMDLRLSNDGFGTIIAYLEGPRGQGARFDIRGGGDSGDTVNFGGDIFFVGGSSARSQATRVGGDLQMLAGGAFGALGNGGIVFIRGGSATASNTRGYVVVGLDGGGTPNKFSLTSSNAQSSLYIQQALEVDGAAFMDGALTVVGTTTLATSLDGLATLTAGVVGELNGVQGDLAYYSGTNTLTVLNKNTSATRYLSNTGASNNPAWAQVDLSNGVTGTLPLSSTSLIVPDDVKFYIGDNSQTAGNVSIVNDQAVSGNLVFAPENGFAGQIYFDDLSATIESNLTACQSATWANVAIFGAALSAPQFTPSAIHGIVSRKQASTAGTGGIAGVLEMEWAGTSSSSSAYQALNLFVHNTSGSASLSSSTSGGGLRSRALTRQRSTSGTIAQMSTYSLILVQDASTGTVSLGSTLNIESPTVGLGSTMTEWRGVSFDVPAAVSGTVGTAKFIHVPSLSGTFGTTQMEVFLDTDAGIFLRESGNQIYSSAAATLDIDTTTTFNNRIGGTVKLALTTTLLDINSAVNVRPNILTASRVVKTDGSKNLVSLTPSSAYTPTNVTTDRSYDANATKVDELADVLGTLIADLQTAGILG